MFWLTLTIVVERLGMLAVLDEEGNDTGENKQKRITVGRSRCHQKIC